MDAENSFDIALRGYDRVQVDALVVVVESALAAQDAAALSAARERLRAEQLAVALRGYDIQQVDEYLKRAAIELGEAAPQQEFTVVLRGFDREQVDKLVREVLPALDSEDVFQRAAARGLLRSTKFDVRWWGYDRAQVDIYVAHLNQMLSS